ncbi:MAG: hypothetical protein ACRDEA_16420 [Microcystaceae cyanobacterium]
MNYIVEVNQVSEEQASQKTQNKATVPAELVALVGQLFEATASETQKFIERTTEQTGHTLQAIAENPVLKFLSDRAGMSWLNTILGQVEVEQVQATVRQLQFTYPQETPSQIANRIMIQKAWQAGQIGLITNIIPPLAVVLLGVELIAMVKLQAEMVYHIAAAYELDLREPARRGEVLAIFGLAVGGGFLKDGLSIVEFIPGLGAIVGASSDAILLYILGYTACRFYEAKSQLPTQTTTVQSAATEGMRDAQQKIDIKGHIVRQ